MKRGEALATDLEEVKQWAHRVEVGSIPMDLFVRREHERENVHVDQVFGRLFLLTNVGEVE